MFYLLSDHLGSTNLVVDESGNKFAELRYRAWGETRFTSGTAGTDYRYTGQREEAGIGLYYYRARWYDPALGRFAQADTIVSTIRGPIGWDRYAYGLGNPVRYVDPEGRSADEGCGMGGPNCDLGDEDGVGGDDGSDDQDENVAGHVRSKAKPGARPGGPFCDIFPFACGDQWWNPFTYETFGFRIPWKWKAVGGVEFQPIIYMNLADLRDLDVWNMEDGRFEVRLFVEGQASLGLSEMTAVGVGVIGSEGTLLDQLGVSGPDPHIAACPFSACLGVDAGFDSNLELESIGYFGGGGQGVDLSVGSSLTDFVAYVNQDIIALRVPLTKKTWVFGW